MKKRILVLTTLLAVLSIGTASVSYVYATGSSWNNVIYPGVYIEDINVGGKELVEVEELIQKTFSDGLQSRKIEIKVNGKSYILDYSMIKGEYNTDEVIKAAFNYGKGGNFIEKYKLIKREEDKKFDLKFSYNSKVIDDFINGIEKEVNVANDNAKISIQNGAINIIPEINGVKLQKSKLKEAILDVINGEEFKEYVNIEAPIEIIKPEITAKELSAVNTPIASFSTNFSTSTANRVNNIELATRAINGTLLMPGESFSFNETVGKRTKDRGYKEAGVIVGDKIESGLGGGICQVSSTLYRAILNSDIQVDERRNHSLPLGYIGKGLDATVDWGNIDLRFTNTLNIPIYIEGFTKNKNVYFNIYSDKELTRNSYEMVTDISIVEPKIVYVDDNSLLQGESRVIKAPSNGYRVEVYRKTFEDGKLINTELISKDYYRPRGGEIALGTKERNE